MMHQWWLQPKTANEVHKLLRDNPPRKKAKIAIIDRIVEVNKPDSQSGLDILAKIGGYEIGGIAGLILAGAYHRRPVVIDGFISTAGALIADCLCPQVRSYLFAGHCSEEPGHKIMLRHLELAPIIDLGMRLGEGTGGALAMGVIEAAAAMFKEVMTFEEAHSMAQSVVLARERVAILMEAEEELLSDAGWLLMIETSTP